MKLNRSRRYTMWHPYSPEKILPLDYALYLSAYEEILRFCADCNGSSVITAIVNGKRVFVLRPDDEYPEDYLRDDETV